MPCSAEAPIAQKPEQIALGVRADVARAARLLVVCDFDGTMSPLVGDPAEATIDPHALSALRALSLMPGTTAAVLSGRGLSDLRARLGDHSRVRLIGSHGGEAESRTGVLSPLQLDLLDSLQHELALLADGLPGAAVERKPQGVAFHFRRADAASAAAVLPRVVQLCDRFADVHLRRGKCVIEFAVVPVTKGDALTELRADHDPNCTIFLGDDTTDEDAFAALLATDIGVKVGPGPTLARFRVDGVAEAARLLTELAAARGTKGTTHA